ncbi:3-ketoacyl-CoA thiolase, mitochondrial isoform X2 [Castor canadensis]|jgi:acetyl-CoA acyltransferase 2|uniref:3-ketoacyl-CoA thiolase, mitochondrial isoform X2 n=1 Tax=Castor canadensis TaxID=51338 RepID=A0A8B7W1M2_CASCN
MSLLRGVFIVAAKRTPFGAYGGSLKDFTATDLSEFAAKAALSAGKVPPETVDSVIVGNVIQNSSDAIYLARHVGLRVGIPKETSALTVNRLCGSGFQSIVSGCQEICAKDAEVVLCGGTESMSQAPHLVRNMRFGTKLGLEIKLEDTLWEGLTDTHVKIPMAITAENLAEQHKISREECDRYALQSQQRWKAANDAGYFNEEMAPIEVKTRKGKQTMQVDEHARPQTTLEQLQKLPPVFKKEGTVTAGNASGVSDGAGAVIIASEDAVKKHNFTPLARVVSYFASGCDPSIMGIGPVSAISGALKKAGLTLKDMDLVDVNEAFAPQYLAVQKSLDLDPSKTNVNGGAIALGHPLGGSGARITAHLVHELRRRGGKYAVGSACIGGGQGIAVIIENTA